MRIRLHSILTLLTIILVLDSCSPASQIEGTGNAGQWRHAGANHAAQKYAALDQIDASNFASLEVAWRWQSIDSQLPRDLAYPTGDFRAVPLVINGVMYTNTNHGQVVALNPESGELIWRFDPESYRAGRPNFTPLQTRGIEYWTDGEIERLFVATLGKQLVSIDITTGQPDPDFGDNGFVDLRGNLGKTEFEIDNITHGAPPIAVGNSVIVGSKIFDYTLFNRSPPGHVRAYDAYTGQFKWRFNTIPQQGEQFTETWENDAWQQAGNTNVWTFMSADDEAGIVYLPTSTPTNDYWGGDRLGENLFAESLVALDADTGDRIWHFQTVHHGLWDYDIASAPNLADIVVDGKPIKAVAQVSKTGFTYVFDRLTGEPVWPIEELTVPQSNVPGERTHPTQPHPTWPLPFDRQGMSEADLIDFTPEIATAALELAQKFVLGPLFTPPIVEGTDGKEATIFLPGAGGGANHPGANIDPETNILYVQSHTRPYAMSLVPPDDPASDWPYVIRVQRNIGPMGLPLVKPPYRRITAIDLDTGEHVWQVPFGRGPVDHPAIAHLDLPDLGSVFNDVSAEGGLLITRSLLITYLAQKDEISPDSTGSILVALDKTTGIKVGELMVDRRLHGPVMSYEHNGRQFITVAGGRFDESELISFALPAAQ
jgi:quinoprotein glucose dehydrogenase